MSTSIHLERLCNLNKQPQRKSGYVLYWMQSAQRINYNHALIYAIEIANKYNADLVVYFTITDNFPEANARHYYFMLEGLQELVPMFENLNIRFVIEKIDPIVGVTKISQNASLVITDCGYLKIERFWRKQLAEKLPCLFTQVETNVIIPVQEVSTKEEYSAATIRRKIHKHLGKFLVPAFLPKYLGKYVDLSNKFQPLQLKQINTVIKSLNIDHTVPKSKYFYGGFSKANILLNFFIENKLANYSVLRNEPSQNCTSNLSPYLHFGQISPLEISLKVNEAMEINPQLSESSAVFLEEMIVRRELAINFTYYNSEYDNYTGLPSWAKQSLNDHQTDTREYIYTLEQLEKSQTHDEYWNAAQKQLLTTGKMQGYMRMYWGKKILEWSPTPQLAYKNTLYLNNKYSLDGRDANAFAGIAWCFGKHDRPWGKRKIFGNIRYMNKKGLERKFKMQAYLEAVANLRQ